MAAKNSSVEETVEDMVEDAQERLEKASTFIGKQANELRKTVAHQLREAKKNIRTQVKGRELDADQKAQVNNVLNRLDSMSDYLENHTIEEMEEQATKAVQENVWRNLLFAVVVGIIVGILLSRRD